MAVTSPITFLKEVRTELSKVIWPTRAETIKLTAVVIGLSTFVGIYVGLLDGLFVFLTGIIVKR